MKNKLIWKLNYVFTGKIGFGKFNGSKGA